MNRRRLQDFNFKESQYERPTQKWTCGWLAAGRPCRLGPDSKGHCPGGHECRPLRKKSGWECTRAPAAGGRCKDGPLPDGTCCREIPRCQPSRTLRAKRSVLSFLLSALSVGCLLLFLGVPVTPELHSPGRLTSGHAVSATCADCHTAAAQGVDGWLETAWMHRSSGVDESARCLGCHGYLGEHAAAVHNVPASRLAEATARAEQTSAPPRPTLVARLAALGPGVPRTPDGGIACATCHKEHQGASFSLSHLDDAQCQSCHVKPFALFAQDDSADGHGAHPEFVGYPFRQRTRLHFDHNTHLRKHFKSAPDGSLDAQNVCASCHELGPAGRRILTKGFETACATCHDWQIGSGASGGIALLRFPAVDVESLNRAGESFRVGQWPELAVGGVTPFMRLLLSQRDDFMAAARELGEVDLTRLGDVGEEKLAAARTYVLEIKRLLSELEKGSALESLAGLVGSEDGGEADGRRLLHGQLQLEVARIREKWFPGLAGELDAYRDEEPIPAVPVDADATGAASSGEDLPNVGNWRQSRYGASLRYVPPEHADPFVKRWLDLSGRLIGSDVPGARELFEELSSPSAPGRCGKCHGAEVGKAGAVQLNWQARRYSSKEHGFTEFSHRAHMNIPSAEACLGCHGLKAGDNYDVHFTREDGSRNYFPERFESNFEPIQTRTCSGCHDGENVRNDCLTCHNYHVGEFEVFHAESLQRP